MSMNWRVFSRLNRTPIWEVKDMENRIALKGSFTIQYLLPCTDGYLLVEAGGEKDFSSFLRELSKHDVDP
jgi:hypothetical protein